MNIMSTSNKVLSALPFRFTSGKENVVLIATSEDAARDTFTGIYYPTVTRLYVSSAIDAVKQSTVSNVNTLALKIKTLKTGDILIARGDKQPAITGHDRTTDGDWAFISTEQLSLFREATVDIPSEIKDAISQYNSIRDKYLSYKDVQISDEDYKTAMGYLAVIDRYFEVQA